MAEAEKADRIDHAGQSGQKPRQDQAACLAAPRGTIAVDHHLCRSDPLSTPRNAAKRSCGRDAPATKRTLSRPLVTRAGGYHFVDHRRLGLPLPLRVQAASGFRTRSFDRSFEPVELTGRYRVDRGGAEHDQRLW